MTMSQLAFTDVSGAPVALDRDLLARLAQYRLTGAAYSVLLILLANCDPGTGAIRASQKEIAEEAGIARQAANGAFKALMEKGIIERGELRRHYVLNRAFINNTPSPPAPAAEQAEHEVEYQATPIESSADGRPSLRLITNK